MTTVAPETAEEPNRPFHLRDHDAPVTEEVTATDPPVIGTVPDDLSGRNFRNCPDPRRGESAHWFLGDGTIHGIRVRGGRAVWYRNRWVQTRALDEPDARMIGNDGSVDRTIGVANTHVVEHDGRILALVESSADVDGDPVARAPLPRRVPFGFHGSWIPDPEQAAARTG